jgi:hypothetical protein
MKASKKDSPSGGRTGGNSKFDRNRTDFDSFSFNFISHKIPDFTVSIILH